jgi:hypothetical protein
MGYSYPERGTIPVGGITAWAKDLGGHTPPLPIEYHECDGSVLNDPESPYHGDALPDLNAATESFLRGSDASGTTGGSTTSNHRHAVSGNTATNTDSLPLGAVIGVQLPAYSKNTSGHLHSMNLNSQYTAPSILPTFYSVVWVIRVK